MEKITVCIADMDTEYRTSLRKELEASNEVQVLGDTGDGAEMLDLVEAHHPQVLLTDVLLPGLDGLEKMAALMKSLRSAPPVAIAGVDVAVRKDYQDGSAVDCATGKVSKMELSGSNVLRFELTDGTTILVRPSGTEPKIKVYILTKGADAAERDANIEKYSAWVKTLTE